MRIYPDPRFHRIDVMARDLATVLGLVLFGLIGLEVHDAVDKLAVLGEGVESAGNGISGGFEAAADAVDGTPLVGDDIGDALRDARAGSRCRPRSAAASSRCGPPSGCPTARCSPTRRIRSATSRPAGTTRSSS